MNKDGRRAKGLVTVLRRLTSMMVWAGRRTARRLQHGSAARLLSFRRCVVKEQPRTLRETAVESIDVFAST